MLIYSHSSFSLQPQNAPVVSIDLTFLDIHIHGIMHYVFGFFFSLENVFEVPAGYSTYQYFIPFY